MPLNPAMLLVIGVVTGVGGMVTYSVFNLASKAGSEFSISDLMPMPPPSPPVPRFLYKKPGTPSELRRRKR